MAAIIKYVESDSIAEEIGLEAGDTLLEINNTEIKDVLDYRYLINDELITLKILTKQGETVEVEFEKDAYEPLGAEFENSLMDKPLHCSNKCVFCFIDQLPKGMRESLY
ncbi:MAG: radical SAM protein, partial [Ruminococcus sp.]|nr:radical SAM protein [Ruminococcus sp.]